MSCRISIINRVLVPRQRLSTMVGRMSKTQTVQVVPRVGLWRPIFINTENTPNPNSLKFVPKGQEVLREGFGTGLFFQKGAVRDIQRSPLAEELFKLGGIRAIFFGRDFITITKENSEVWNSIKPLCFSKILDFYSTGKEVIEEYDTISDTTILETDDEVVATIKELLETRVRPSVQEDGGDIFYEGFNPVNGIVSVRLAGSCVGCPSSSMTLRNGVENMLTHYVPEVKGIEEVGGAEEDLEVGRQHIHVPQQTAWESLTGHGLSP